MGWAERSIEINGPVEDCFAIWTDANRLPDVMSLVKQVWFKGNQMIWHWEVEDRPGQQLAWDTVVDLLVPNQVISWHSIDNAVVDSSGAVRFHPIEANQKTRVTLEIMLNPPVDPNADFAGDVFRNPQHIIDGALDRLKYHVERQLIGVMGAGARVTPGPLLFHEETEP